MKKYSSTQDGYRNEKAIIDALLKISEIVQKIEANRQGQKKLINSRNERSNKAVGDGDYNELYDDHQELQQVPMPPPMRTLDSYVSGFNQQSLQKPSNCNQASSHTIRKHSPSSSENNKQCDQSSKNHSTDTKDNKRHYDEISLTSSSSSNINKNQQKKCSRHDSNHRSVRSDKNSERLYQQIENQPIINPRDSQTTSYRINSATTNTLHDDQSPSVNMTPIPSIPNEQPYSSTLDTTKNSKIDFDHFIDEQLQSTLEKYLKNSLLSSKENYQQNSKSVTLTKSETDTLTENCSFSKSKIPNLEHYEKQCELAMNAAKQGNYSLSYSIYTNLLHDHQYDYKIKSDILSSRATILLFDNKCFESIDDCTQAIAYNQWNKLAYIIRGACWMIKQEYFKAIDDYSKLFHFFDKNQHVLDLLNLAYEKFKLSNHQ